MSISCEIVAERRPFKSIEFVASEGVAKDTPTVTNPNHRLQRSTRRPFKELVYVCDLESEEDELCTTRKVDVDGTELWHKDHGATVTGVTIDDDGDTYEVGAESRGVTLRKRDPDGVQLWKRKHGADLNCCALCPDGIVVGGKPGTGGATIRKYGADGSELWSFTTPYEVIEIAADSGGNVAALDGPPTFYDRVIYAIASDGTLMQAVTHGTHEGTNFVVWPAGICFSGLPDGNSGLFTDPFVVFLNVYSFHTELGYGVRNVGYSWSWQLGYPDAFYGSGLGDIFTHSSEAMPDDFPPMWGTASRSTIRGMPNQSEIVRTGSMGTWANSWTGGDWCDSISSGLGLCSRPGFVWVGNNYLERFSLVTPPPASLSGDRVWKEFPDWRTPHGGLIRDCQANASNVSILGGVQALVGH